MKIWLVLLLLMSGCLNETCQRDNNVMAGWSCRMNITPEFDQYGQPYNDACTCQCVCDAKIENL